MIARLAGRARAPARMQAVRLDFDRRRIGRPGAGILALAAASLAWTGHEAWQVHADLQALRTAQAPAPGPGAAASPRPSPTASRPDRAAAPPWSLALRPLNTPWSALLESLERLTPPEVALVSIEPDGPRGRVRLQAEARTLDALLAYAAAFRDAPGFGPVTLVHHETLEQDPQRPVRLALDVVLLHEPVQPLPGGSR